MERQKIKILCTVYEDSVISLDCAVYTMKQRKIKGIDRSTLIRAILDAVGRSDVDLWDCESEHEVMVMLLHQLTTEDKNPDKG